MSQGVSLFWCKYVLTGINSLRPGKKLWTRNEVRSRPLLSSRNCCLFLCWCLWFEVILLSLGEKQMWCDFTEDMWNQSGCRALHLWWCSGLWDPPGLVAGLKEVFWALFGRNSRFLPKMNITMIYYRNLTLQSGTNSSSPGGVIILKCFSKEVPVLQNTSVPVLSRRVHAATLISQQLWAQMRMRGHLLWCLTPFAVLKTSHTSKIWEINTLWYNSTWVYLILPGNFAVVPGSLAIIPKIFLFSVKAACATEGWMKTLLFSIFAAAVLGSCWMIYIFGKFLKHGQIHIYSSVVLKERIVKSGQSKLMVMNSQEWSNSE